MAGDGRRLWVTTIVVGALVVALGVVTAVQGWVLGRRTEALASCQQQYSNAFADALNVRTEANVQAQAQSDRLWTVVGEVLTTPGPDSQERLLTALTDYLAARAEARQAAATNPYPPPPRDCEELR